MARSLLPLALIGLLAGCAHGPTIGPTLGTPPPAGVATAAIAELKASPEPVTVEGMMYEKCPESGCWFMLRDKTGVIKVDMKDTEFTVTEVPLNSTMTVSGYVEEVGERTLVATGLRYR